MNNAYFWGTVIPLSLGTLFIRLSFIFISRLRISKKLEKLFTYIPAAVLPALFTPMVIFYKTNPDFLFDYQRTLAFIIAVVFCLYFKSILFTILVGLLSLFVIQGV
jgi:branched-subunit amino acid transport protein